MPLGRIFACCARKIAPSQANPPDRTRKKIRKLYFMPLQPPSHSSTQPTPTPLPAPLPRHSLRNFPFPTDFPLDSTAPEVLNARPRALHRASHSHPQAAPTGAARRVRQSSSVVEQRTHKPLVGGSNPPSATLGFSRKNARFSVLSEALFPTAWPLLAAHRPGPWPGCKVVDGRSKLAPPTFAG